MPEPLTFAPLMADDVLAIRRQPSQAMVLGIDGTLSRDDAETMAEQRVAHAAFDAAGTVRACFGIAEIFEGMSGVAWALLAPMDVGQRLALTRFARAALAGCGLQRVEALALGPAIEEICAAIPRPFWLAEALLQPTPEMRWAEMIGLDPAAVLRRYGAAADIYVLAEWFGRDS